MIRVGVTILGIVLATAAHAQSAKPSPWNVPPAKDAKPDAKAKTTVSGIDQQKVCASYGTGFAYVPGTTTCVKIGGYTRFEASGGR